MKLGQLHCGACMMEFDNIDDLNEHLDDCPAALYVLPLMYQLWGGNDKSGHPLAHFIRNLHKYAHLVKRYAYSIADEMDSFHRSEIHAELCDKLELGYNEFRPFESSEIKEIPDRKEAERVLWQALSDFASKLFRKGK